MDKQPVQLDPIDVVADADVVVIQDATDGGVKQATIQQLKSAALTGDWTALSVVPTTPTGYNKGQKEQELTYANINLSTFISPGHKMKVDRTGTVPTQCMAFTAASSQYAGKASPSGISFTAAFTTEVTVYPLSYASSVNHFINQFNNAGTTGGWFMFMRSGGTVVAGYATGSSFTQSETILAVPLNRWTHIAATVNATSKIITIYFNGVAMATTQPFSAATAVAQDAAANLRLGAAGATPAGTYFNGYMSEARVWSTTRSATQILDNMSINLVGNETGLVFLAKGNGNFNDSTANGNNLTASGAIATQSANPFKSTEYAYVTKVTYSAPNTVVTVFTGTDHNIPNMTLQNPYYSGIANPYGFPSARGKWRAEAFHTGASTTSSPANGSYNQTGSFQLTTPIGDWILSYEAVTYANRAAGNLDVTAGLSTSLSSFDDPRMTSRMYSSSTDLMASHYRDKPISITAQTNYYLLLRPNSASHSALQLTADLGGQNVICAELAYK